MRRLRKADAARTAMLVVGLALAIAIRLPLLGFKSGDFYSWLNPWYRTIQALGYHAFATSFSNYNPPYLYALYLIARFAPHAPAVIAVKIPGLLGDFACAYFVYRIVRLSDRSSILCAAAALLALFAPTMVVNSAMWGQDDSLYTAGLLACICFLLEGNPAASLLAYGIALAVKLQALFLAPFLLALFVRRRVSWQHALVVPLVLLLALVPAWLAGRPFSELLSIYQDQTSQYRLLTLHAPTIYAWLPNAKALFDVFYIPGLLAAASAALAVVILIYKSRRPLSRGLLVEVALLSMIVVPFFLPKMHERYFFPADVLSITLAFYFPRLFFLPILMNAASWFAYTPILMKAEFVPLPALTLVVLILICVLTYHCVTQLYRGATGGDDTTAGRATGTVQA